MIHEVLRDILDQQLYAPGRQVDRPGNAMPVFESVHGVAPPLFCSIRSTRHKDHQLTNAVRFVPV
jgi:hypothetical protein